MNKIIIYLVVVLVFIILAGFVGAYFLYNKTDQPKITACTMEAKLCPDGTAVGRTGPNCEFTACPVVKLSGIKGIALLGPMCPVERIPPDPACADRPYKTDLAATSPNGTQIFQKFSSGADGKFSVDLAPGEYIVSSSDSAKIFSRCTSEGTIKVEENKYADIILRCDTGIR